jgi:hypothetical protein
MRQGKFLSRSLVEKAVRTDSQTKHSDSLSRQFIQEDLLSCRLQKFDCASLKDLASQSRGFEMTRALAR